MNIGIGGVTANYRLRGEGEKTLLLLHGWGVDSREFENLMNVFFRVA